MRRTTFAASGLVGGLLVWTPAAVAAATQVAPPSASAGERVDGGPPGAEGDSPRRPGRRGPPNVFISPSGEPFRAAPDAPYAAADWFRGADVDGDGRLTRAEFITDAERFFRRLDTDGDGVIDGFEAKAYEERVAPEILPRIGGLSAGEGQDRDLFHDRNGGVGGGGRRGGGGGHGHGGGGRDGGTEPARGRITASDTRASGAGAYGMLNEPEPVQACDADLDGRVSLAEWRAKAARRFILLDVKGAGVLTLDTLPRSYVQEARDKAAKRKAEPPKRAPDGPA